MRLMCALVSLVASIFASIAIAQDYPSRPVKIIVPFPTGGASDIVGRIFAEGLSDLWKQQVIVENRVGAGGSIGTEVAYRAKPDGYTLLLATTSPVVNQVLISQLPFTYTKDFPTVAVVTSAPMMIAVHPSVPANNLKELTAMFKTAPGKHDYTACDMASQFHLAMEMYKQAVGVFAVHIAHRGCGPAITDAVAGHIKIAVTNLPAALPFLKQGRLKAIALMSKDRSPSAANVPTVRESEIPQLKDYYLENYYGFMAPPKTPPAIVAKVEADILNLAARPDVRKRLEGAGLDMLVLNSKQMAELIRADADKYARVAKQAGIKVE
jgi:tripartite-type tricarboxylate transporter receptor subunit TctC